MSPGIAFEAPNAHLWKGELEDLAITLKPLTPEAERS